ncbi:hypothetical protein F8M41_000109 [Gigaspora margarita]|uniref:F-box domain-containing protein n=1 Tax=Gigaspora margarita TaxID=4874 RepID=A0A8H4B553_GIGMA|nr:hypothetical protein F8M41_000109 [Gigaspora margarita]
MMMGDMPELMEIILNNLNNEFYSLYSCALVSRHWCKMTIPIIWQNPFSFDQNPLFISQYFSSFDENEKFGLEKYGINVNFADTLFNYAGFLKVLNSYNLECTVQKWLDFQLADSSSKYPIINLLFNFFVKSGATLEQFAIYYTECEISLEVFDLLEKNELFFSQLQDLSFNLLQMSDFKAECLIALFTFLTKTTTKIKVLKIEEFCYIHEPRLFHALECFIKSQEQLRQFSLISGENIL